MSKIALVVEFQLKPDCREEFLALMRDHAAGTLSDEEGCLQFDILLPEENGGCIFLYEVYRDDAAIAAHRKSPRLARTRANYGEMIESRTIRVCKVD